MFRKILIILVIALVAFGGFAAMQPDDFRYSRSLAIAAPAPAIFENVNDLHKWDAWSPWAKLDPNAQHGFAGPNAGKDAAMSWDGNMEVGKGSMTITESRPAEFIQFRLDFLKPMKATHTAEFTFKPEGKQTLVTWTMYGKSNFISKAMGLIFNCEKMVGGQFETGLSNLKAVVESKKGA